MDSPALYAILDSTFLIALIASYRFAPLVSRSHHISHRLRLPRIRRSRLAIIILALTTISIIGLAGSYFQNNGSGGVPLANPQPAVAPGSLRPESYAQYSGTLAQGGSASYTLFLTQSHIYAFDLDVLTTNSSVEFELRLYNQFGGLIDSTTHNPSTQGISVGIDEYIQTSMNYNITVVSIKGSANYTLWVFDDSVQTPQYTGTFSDPSAHLENYEKTGGNSYYVYLEQFVSYDIQLTNKPAFTDFQLQITDLFGVVINSTTAPAGTDNALDFSWRGLTGYYFVRVVKGTQSPITAAGNYVLGIYRLYVGDIGANPNNPVYSPQYKKLVSNQTGDLYDLNLRQNFAYSFELQGFPSTSNFQIRILDSLGHVIANSSWATAGQEASIGLPWIKNTGTYYVQVLKVAGTGNYELTMWSLNLGSPNTQPVPSYNGNTSPAGKKVLINSNGDYYMVWLDQFVSYDIELTGKSVTANLQFQVLDIAGKSFYNSSIPVGSDGSGSLIWKDNPGYYYIRVFGVASSGPYMLTMWRLFVDPQQPTYSPSGVTILPSDIGDIYTVAFTQGMAYDINLFPTLGGNMTLRITDQVNTIFYNNQTTNGRDLSLDFVWTKSTGNYFVYVLKQTGTGPYSVEFWKMNIPSIATPTIFTKTFLSQDSNDILAVNLQQSIAYDFELVKPSGAALDLKLQDIFGTTIASTTSPPGVDVSLNYVNARPPGTYYLIINRNDLSTGQYTLRLWRMDLGAPSNLGTPSFSGKQILANDTGDIYDVYLQQGFSYDVDLQKSSTSNFQLELRDAFNNLVAGPTSAPVGQDTSLDFVWVNSAGYAYIRVIRVNGTGSYSLTVWNLYMGSPGTPTVSPPNKQILANDTGDTYALSLINSYSYSFDLFKPWGTSMELKLVNNLGVTVAGSTISPAGQSVSLDLILNQPSGIYYLKVIRVTGSGPYTLKLWGLYLGVPGSPTNVGKDMASNDTGDIYALNLLQTYSYDFNLYKPSGSQLELSLTNSSGAIISGPTSSSGSDIVSLDLVLKQASGFYYLHVLRTNGTGIYSLKLWTLLIGGQGQSPAGEDLAGIDSVDIYTVFLTTGYSYTVDLFMPSNANFQISLMAANGTSFYTTNSPAGIPVSLDFIWTAQPGTYYIEVLRVAGYGAYALSFTPLTGIGSPGSTGQSFAGSIISSSDSMDIWSVFLVTGQPYEFNLVNMPSNAHFELSLTNSASTAYFNSSTTTGFPASLSFIWRNPSGTYYLRVLRVSGSGSYTLLARSPTVGSPSLAGTTLIDTIYSNSSIATMSLQTGGVYDIEMRSLPSNTRFGIQLLASNGSLVLQTQPPTGATGGLSFTWNSSSVTAYLKITKISGSGTFTVLVYGNDMGHVTSTPSAAINHYLSDANSAALFKAQLDANYSYAFVLYSSNLTFSILNSTTGQVISGPFGSGTTIWRANIAATYYFLVSKRPGQVSSDLYSLYAGQLSQFTLKIVDPPANGYVGGSFTVIIQAQDPVWGVTQVVYQIDGGAWQPTYVLSQGIYSAQMNATLLGEGPHVITARATNGAGVAASQMRGFLVDLTPPTVKLVIASPYANVTGLTFLSGNSTLSLNATDKLSGVQSVYYRINGGSWLVYTSGFKITGSDGTYTVEYYAVDKAGNTGTTQSKIVALDNTAPTVSILSPQAGVTLNSGTVTITWSGSDTGSGISYYEIKIDSGTFTNLGTATSYTTTQLAAGNHSITLVATDNVGNTKTLSLNIAVAGSNPLTSAGNLPLIAGLSLAGILVLLFLFVRRRRKNQEMEIVEAGFPKGRDVSSQILFAWLC